MLKQELHKPLVSIVIPCYNCERFVGEAIESAMAQSYSPVEIIVVDDGSIDNSREVIARYPVRLFCIDHQGVSAARNRGIDESAGEFLLFLDSDDRLLPNAVACGVKILTDHPDVAMAVAGHNLITVDGQIIRTRLKLSCLEDSYEHLLLTNFIECTSSTVFRRSMFPVSMGFPVGLEGAEDYELYLRVVREHPIRCTGEVVTEYRQHGGSSSRKNAEKILVNTLRALRLQKPYIIRNIRYRAAYYRGWWSWTRKYGRQLTREVASASSASTR